MNKKEDLVGKEIQYFMKKDADDEPIVVTCRVLKILETGVELDTIRNDGAFYNKFISFGRILAVIIPVRFGVKGELME